ncbi:hypothetical protein [Spirosoma endbachense]|uniref:hypothetical protein n=1 Tax=Spirosoma endbachense TaxID=2666025 RepID=UPI00139090DC|nr:hypothetical protein [Spirosoma endbachense]
MSLFITFYVAPMLFILICGWLTDSQEATMQIAIPIAIIPVLNVLATIGCIGVTIRTMMDWVNR